MHYVIGLIIGLAVGWNVSLSDRATRLNELLIRGSLVVLLIAMGMRIGADPRILSSLGTLGLQALALTVGGMAGSVVAIQLVARFLFVETDGEVDGQ